MEVLSVSAPSHAAHSKRGGDFCHFPFISSVDSLDWKDLSASDICKRVLGRVGPGSIVLFHNAAKNTPEALPTIIEGLIQKGYTFLPISELIYKEGFSIDHTGRQIPTSSTVE